MIKRGSSEFPMHPILEDKEMSTYTAFVVEKTIKHGAASNSFVGAAFTLEGAEELVRLDRFNNPSTNVGVQWRIREYKSEQPAHRIIEAPEDASQNCTWEDDRLIHRSPCPQA